MKRVARWRDGKTAEGRVEHGDAWNVTLSDGWLRVGVDAPCPPWTTFPLLPNLLIPTSFFFSSTPLSGSSLLLHD